MTQTEGKFRQELSVDNKSPSPLHACRSQGVRAEGPSRAKPICAAFQELSSACF